jgi:putative intracellular protease/amidase
VLLIPVLAVFQNHKRNGQLKEVTISLGMKVTGFHSIAKDITNAGGEYIDKDVVVDKNIITSRKPDDLPAFCRNIIEMIEAYFD